MAHTLPLRSEAGDAGQRRLNLSLLGHSLASGSEGADEPDEHAAIRGILHSSRIRKVCTPMERRKWRHHEHRRDAGAAFRSDERSGQ